MDEVIQFAALRPEYFNGEMSSKLMGIGNGRRVFLVGSG
jgi:hypothetical protein